MTNMAIYNKTRGPWATKPTRAPVQNYLHLRLDWHDDSCMLDLKLYNLLTCVFVRSVTKTINATKEI